MTIQNDIKPGIISFEETKIEFDQSQRDKIVLKVLRGEPRKGKVVVPWTVSSHTINSPYQKLQGQETFEDGEGKSHIEIDVVQLPRNAVVDKLAVQLGKPRSANAVVDDVMSRCDVTINNDIGELKLLNLYF